MRKKLTACTTILVGKNATVDGSTMAARNDDTPAAITPQRFVVYPAYHNNPNQVHAYLNKFVGDRPADGYRYQGVPNVNLTKEGTFDENGFNEKNIAMSATESFYANERVLAADPMNTESGINEDAMMAMVLPFINSAKEGVEYLGKLVAKYGSAEGNGVIFSDKNDIWYMEIATGHHWVAERIPDDCYAVTGNRAAIQDVDFNDPDNFMWSDGIQDFVEKNHLNPDIDEWNFRHIFGTADVFDLHYNTPRQWYGHFLFSPDVEMDPEDFDLPFIMKARHKFTLEDVEKYLSSHYENTPFDPLGHMGTKQQKLLYRPISLNRTQNSHIMQVRPNVPESASAIMWMTFGGIPSFSPYMPFFAQVDDNDERLRNTAMKMDLDSDSIYWMFRQLSMIVESHLSEFTKPDLDYLKSVRQYFYSWVAENTAKLDGMSDKDATDYLNDRTKGMLDEVSKRTKNLMAELMTKGVEMSKLTFDMDPNL